MAPTPSVFPRIPETITVHLGAPTSNAQNVTVAFPDYIKNVASSEIYPTWDINALHSNILAQISFALNRVYTEFYRAQGKNFDITSSTAIDQKFIAGRNIFESVERVVDEIFNDYIRRIGFIEPLAAKFCNGTTSTCDGLSQWGSEELAQAGVGWLDILYRYYGYNIEIVVDAPIQNMPESYPGYPVRPGDRGAYVQIVQTMLNRISVAYPAIPKTSVDGIFGAATESAVKAFQRIFNLTADGIVGRATWYKMVGLYTGLNRFSELNSVGQTFFGYNLQYPGPIGAAAVAVTAPGQNGAEANPDAGVSILQFFIAYIAEYNPIIPSIAITGLYNEETRNAVTEYQRNFDLPPTGIVTEETWDSMYSYVVGIARTQLINSERINLSSVPYPGTPLGPGAEGDDVRLLQNRLNAIALTFRTIPPVFVNGIYDETTEAAVRAYQGEYGLPVTGITDQATWNSVGATFLNAVSVTLTNPTQFPGRELSEGDQDGENGLGRGGNRNG